MNVLCLLILNHTKSMLRVLKKKHCLCSKVILKNRINNFSVETCFGPFPNMASSGLKKMFILQFYIHKRCIRKSFPINIFSFPLMADVMPYVRLMLYFGWLLLPVILWKLFYHMSRRYYPCFIIWQMLLPFYQWCSNWYDTTFHVSLIMAGVIAKWQDGTATFHYFEDGRCCCLVAR